MCPSTRFSRTNYLLNRYNATRKLDCFNCKTGVFLRLFTPMFTKENNYDPRFWEKSTPLWGIFNNYKEKIKRSQNIDCSLKLQLHDAIYRLRFYSNSLIHILSLSNSHNNVESIQKNRGYKSYRVIVALSNSTTLLRRGSLFNAELLQCGTELFEESLCGGECNSTIVHQFS